MICTDTEVEEPRTAIERRKIPINIQIKTLEICVYFSPGCSSSQSRTRASRHAGARVQRVPSTAPAHGLHVAWDCSLHASKGEFCHLFWVRREGGEAPGGRGAAAGRPQPSPSNSTRLGAVVLQLSPLGPAPISRNVCASLQNAHLSMACASSDETDFSPCQIIKASSSATQPGGGRAEGRGGWREGARPVSDPWRRPRHLVLLSRAFSGRRGCSVGAEHEGFTPIIFQEFGYIYIFLHGHNSTPEACALTAVIRAMSVSAGAPSVLGSLRASLLRLVPRPWG